MGGRGGNYGRGGRGNPLEQALSRLKDLENNPATRGKYGIKRVRPGRWSVVPRSSPGAVNPL